MTINSKRLISGRKILIAFMVIAFTVGFSPFLEQEPREVKANPESQTSDLGKISEFVIFQENSLASLSSPLNPEPEVVGKMKVVVTAYSSTVEQTDSDPYITAAGTSVREGIVANNKYPFGTKIRIPELYGDKIFVVEDRLHWTRSGYQIDIWFPSYDEALDFGAKITYIEVLEN